MSFEIYPPDFSTRYQLTHAISMQMTEHYNDIGKIQIVEPADEYNIRALKEGAILYNTTRGTTYLLVNVKHDTVQNQITANGYTCNWILNKRVVAAKKAVTTIETGVYDLINDNLRGLTRIQTATPVGLTEKFQPKSDESNVVYGGQLFDKIKEILDSGDLGHQMQWDGTELKHTFKVIKGVARTSGIYRVAFVEEQGTCSDLVINKDVSTFKNVAYVKYSLADDTEPVAVVGSATGDDRFERWFDTSISQDDEASADDVAKTATSFGNLQLGRYIKRSSFDVVIDPSELGVRYDIGDVVLCISGRFGVSFSARITGVKYTLDRTGEKTQLVLGDPTLDALSEEKLNGQY